MELTTRRMTGKFLSLLISLAVVVMYGERAGAEGNKVTFISKKVICKEPGRYIGWSTITKTREGELLVVFSGDREGHECPWGKVQMVRSRTGGKTWSDPETVIDTPIDDRDAGIIETKEGTLLVSWFTGLGSKEYQGALKVTPEVREQWLGNWICRSVDGGKTWEEPIRTLGSTPHGPIQLRGGRLLYVGRLWRGEHKNTVEESRDDGRSWKLIATIDIPAGESIDSYWEPHVVETDDGKLIAMFRYEPVDWSKCYLRQSESTDGGRTWSVPHKIPLWGFPPHIIQLKNGWLLAVYGRRIPPYGERACISRDGGKTWDVENEFELKEHPNIIGMRKWDALRDLGYPSSVQLDDDSIWTVYYQLDKPGEKPCLMGTHWRFE